MGCNESSLIMKYITKLATWKGRCLSALWCSWETWQTQFLTPDTSSLKIQQFLQTSISNKVW